MIFRLKLDSNLGILSGAIVALYAIKYTIVTMDWIQLGVNDEYAWFAFFGTTFICFLIIAPFSVILINQFIILKKDHLIICQGIRCFRRTIPITLIQSIQLVSHSKYNICITYTGGAKKYLYVKKAEDLVFHLKNNYGERITFL